MLLKEKEAGVCGVQALCQVLHTCSLLKSSSHPMTVVVICFQGIAEEVEVKELGQDRRVAN